jgi:hypothetical protein
MTTWNKNEFVNAADAEDIGSSAFEDPRSITVHFLRMICGLLIWEAI